MFGESDQMGSKCRVVREVVCMLSAPFKRETVIYNSPFYHPGPRSETEPLIEGMHTFHEYLKPCRTRSLLLLVSTPPPLLHHQDALPPLPTPYLDFTVQGYLAYQKPPTHLGPP